MATKIYRDIITKQITRIVPIYETEEISMLDITDCPVIDSISWEIVKFKLSSQAIARLAELKSLKELNDFEKEEIRFLTSETSEEKIIDVQEAKEILISGRYLVNISNKGKKKIATIHDSTTAATAVEYDPERGDITTDNIDIAEKYKTIVESEWLEIAIERFKTL